VAKAVLILAAAAKGSMDCLPAAFQRAANLASLLNFLFFLLRGDYSSTILRLLGLRLVRPGGRASPLVPTAVDVDLMNRQLLWQALQVASAPLCAARR
jgi:hypothetical protein